MKVNRTFLISALLIIGILCAAGTTGRPGKFGRPERAPRSEESDAWKMSYREYLTKLTPAELDDQVREIHRAMMSVEKSLAEINDKHKIVNQEKDTDQNKADALVNEIKTAGVELGAKRLKSMLEDKLHLLTEEYSRRYIKENSPTAGE